MRNFKLLLGALLLPLTALLGGCGSTPMLHVGNAVFNLGQDLPEEMRDRNLAGFVAFDEDFAGRYNRVARNVLYVNGIVEGTPEYQYRVVRVNIGHNKGAVFTKPGEVTFMTGAMVPDSLPPLKAGDVIEFRQTGTWRTMENFAATGEGNIVLRVLCAKADPDYMKCLDTTPHIGEFKGQGPTGTQYPASAKSLGLQFTPRYTQTGEPLAR